MGVGSMCSVWGLWCGVGGRGRGRCMCLVRVWCEGCTVCRVWCGTLKDPLCVHSKRLRVYQQHVRMYKTCGRGVLSVHTGTCPMQTPSPHTQRPTATCNDPTQQHKKRKSDPSEMEVNARVHLQSTVILRMASFDQHRFFEPVQLFSPITELFSDSFFRIK